MDININNFEQLKALSNEEIEQFFITTEFTGTFSKEIKSKYKDRFCGSMTNIKINKRKSYVVPKFINVPLSFNLEEGDYKFKLKMNDSFFSDNTKYFPTIIYESLSVITNEIGVQTKKDITSKSIEERTQDLFSRWGVESNDIIGFYREDGEDSFVVENIRKINFAKLGFYPGDELKRPIVLKTPFRIKGIKPNEFYHFKWKLADKYDNSPFQIYIDFNTQPKKIDPEFFINTLFDDRHNDTSRNFGSTTNFLDTLSKQLTAREETFVYELLQNANDYPQKGKRVDVEFHITDNYLLFMHSGEYFNVSNISGICGINEKDKISNKEAIGYKGIGFKTVFLNNRYVYIKTGKYSFRFDENAEKIKRIEAPWPILPVWTSEEELSNEITTVFNTTDKKYRVQMALRPDTPAILHSSKNNYKDALISLFSDANTILFTPNINSVTVKVKGETVRKVSKENDNWVLSNYTNVIDDEIQEAINKKIESGKSKIPEKYTDFSQTTISFACRKEGDRIQQIENGNLYCYLPTSTSWGFPFLMNTDMIPKGDRDDIEMDVDIDDDTNFNIFLAGIAGKKYYHWIFDLIQSGNYDYDSIFSLIPDFDYCVETHSKYEDFIREFQSGFESQIKDDNLPFVPVEENNEIEYKPVSEIIYDKTDISTYDFLTDNQILDYASWKDFFAHPTLRDGKWFKEFIKRYHIPEQIFDTDVLLLFCGNEEFNLWVANQSNNNLFLSYLVDKEYIKLFYNNHCKVYLDTNGNLYSSEDVYHDIDEYLYDLESFVDDFLPHLSNQTRLWFNDNDEWERLTQDIFKQFDANEFVESLYLSDNHYKFVEILEEKENSTRYFHFLAETETDIDNFTNTPFFNSDNEIVSDFDGLTFFYSDRGNEVRRMPWMELDWIQFLSEDYFVRDKDVVESYLRSYLSVSDYSDEEVIEHIILNDDYNVNNKLDVWETNYSFVTFTFKNSDNLETSQLSDFQLLTVDKDGDENYYLSDDNVFFYSQEYESFEQQIWTDYNWMRSLSEDYFRELSEADRQNLKEFIKRVFDVREINTESFIKDIVFSNIDSLKSTLEDDSANISFWRWIKENHGAYTSELDTLPLIVLDTSDTKHIYSTDGITVFISDPYMPDSKGIESIVKKYYDDAYFVSPEYLENKTVATQKDWNKYFEELGIKTDISALIYQLISDKQLGEIEDKSLPGIITDVKDTLFDEKNVTLKDLRELQVVTKNEDFHSISQSVFVNNRDSETEPFNDILIENECALSEYPRDTRKLILDIAEDAGCEIISNFANWRVRKLNEYIKWQNDDKISNEVHFKVIEEILNIEENDRSILKSQIKEIKLLSVKDDFKASDELTFGTQYKPFCDFEANGIGSDKLNYISNKYLSLKCDDFIPKLLRKTFNEIHYSFVKQDIELLENYKFAMYFWRDYLFDPKVRKDPIKKIIESNEFKDRVCVPVIGGTVSKAEDLYSRKIVKDYVANKIEDWQLKIPNENIPIAEEDDLLDLLDFREELNFEDGLTALLNIPFKSKRPDILQWMYNSYDENDNKHTELIRSYREEEKATWQNRKRKKVQIKELYALEIDSENSKYLEQYFKNFPLIIDNDYFPTKNSSFEGICNMMNIPIVRWEDMIFKPENSFPADIKKGITRKTLLVAGAEKQKGWEECYNNFTDKLKQLSFFRCDSISLSYSKNENINQNASRFYFDSEKNAFYYVKDWRDRTVFLDFTRKLQKYLESELDGDLFSEIFNLEEKDNEFFIQSSYIDLSEDSKFQKKIGEYFGVKLINQAEEEEYFEAENEYEGPITIRKKTTDDVGGEREDENGESATFEETNEDDSEDDDKVDNGDDTKGRIGVTLTNSTSTSTSGIRTQISGKSDVTGPTHVNMPQNRNNGNGSERYNPENFKRRKFSPGNQDPLILSSANASDDEMKYLSSILGDAYNADRIINENYLVRLRFFNSLKEQGFEHNIDAQEFILNNGDNDIYLNSGKYIHRASARRGTLYISPSIWRKLKDEECIICMYYGKRASDFIYIHNQDELMKMIDNDAILIQVTGNNKKEIVDRVYDESLDSMDGNIYTLIRAVNVNGSVNPFSENPSESLTETVDETDF